MMRVTKSIFLFFLLLNMAQAQGIRPPYSNEIQSFKKQDSIGFPPKNAILFVGHPSGKGGLIDVETIRDRMPAVPILFVSIKPSPIREKFWPKMEEVNKAIKKFLKKKSNSSYADVYHKMFKRDGTLKEDLFIADNLHMNANGYAIWKK